jgi:hypothetical protein
MMRETEGGDAVDVRRGGDVRAPVTGHGQVPSCE